MTAQLPADVAEAAERSRVRLDALARRAALEAATEGQQALKLDDHKVRDIKNANGDVVERHHLRGGSTVVERLAEAPGLVDGLNGWTGVASGADQQRAMDKAKCDAMLGAGTGRSQPHRGILS
jgi:hypothetical protein